MTGSGRALPNVSGSTSCSKGFVGSCIRGGGGELLPTGLGLRLGEREALRFLSLFTGDLRRGDGDLVFRLDREEANRISCHVLCYIHVCPLISILKTFSYLLGLFDCALSLMSLSFSFLSSSTFFSEASFSCSIYQKGNNGGTKHIAITNNNICSILQSEYTVTWGAKYCVQCYCLEPFLHRDHTTAPL